MGYRASIVLVIFFLTFSSYTVLAQAAEGNIIVINNSELAMPQGGTIAEFDSLTNEYNKWCMDNNEYILSYKVLRHWWGHNNRDFITIIEVKNWEDVNTFNDKLTEKFRAHWDTPEKRKAFNDTYNKYFTGSHSDEIYREIVSRK